MDEEQRSLEEESEAAQLTLDGGFVDHQDVVSAQERLARAERERAQRARREERERLRRKPMDPALMQPLPLDGPEL